MPYGVRGKAKGGNPFVRSQALCWVQTSIGGEVPSHIQVIGLNAGRRMVSFWIDPADIDGFSPAYLRPNRYQRLIFESLNEAKEFALELNDRKQTQPSKRGLPSLSENLLTSKP